MSAERLFDQIVIVRWSVASQPTRGDDSTWRASVEVGTEFVECVNNATRIQASRGLVDQLVRRQGRIFVGFDIPFGFPTGFASRIVNPGANWRAMWMAIANQVVDGAHNDDNRFEAAARLNVRSGMSPGPLWGTPDGESRPSLAAARPDTYYGMTEFRLTERRLREAGHEPRPVWQLRGRRAPGSLALLGIPFLRALSEHRELTRRVRIWPFETGCTTTPTHGALDAIVLGEVWPDVFDVDTSSHQLPDAAAAIGLAQYLARLDRAGSLGALFAPSLTPQQTQVVEREEGWVLGA